MQAESIQRPAIFVQSSSEVESEYRRALAELEGKNRELQAVKRTFRAVRADIWRLEEEKRALCRVLEEAAK
jgi:hypothetical protein